MLFSLLISALFSGAAGVPIIGVPRVITLLASRSTAVTLGARRTNAPALLASRSNTVTLGAHE
jgi:P pilus assembly chaperone PapD